MGTTGSFVRVTPEGSIESCVNALEPSAGISDSAATDMIVLSDGSLLYASWGFGGEWRVDLSSPAFSDGSVPCDHDDSEDAEVRYANALSAHDDGFLFLRALDPIEGPIHAEVTDLELVPELRFGGTLSGYGVEGFGLTGAGSRCPDGYCMASELGLTIYSGDGTYTDFVNWLLTLPGVRIDGALDAVEGDAESFILLETSDGLNGVRVTAAP